MKACVLVSTMAGNLLVTPLLFAGDAHPAAAISTPVAGQAVATESRITIEIDGPGQPIVAVRSKDHESLWWIQEVAESAGPGEFTVDARFGNEATPDRTPFEIVALVAPDSRSAEAMKLGSTFQQLPAELAHSSVIEVVLDRTESLSQGATLTAELLAPLPNGEAHHLQMVSMRMDDAAEEVPMLLVRSMERNSPWWVQDLMQRDGEGKFTGLARIGNDKTPAGSRFLLMFVLPNAGSIQEAAPPGTSLKDISGFRRSRVFAVTRAAKADEPIDSLASGS